MSERRKNKIGINLTPYIFSLVLIFLFLFAAIAAGLYFTSELDKLNEENKSYIITIRDLNKYGGIHKSLEFKNTLVNKITEKEDENVRLSEKINKKKSEYLKYETIYMTVKSQNNTLNVSCGEQAYTALDTEYKALKIEYEELDKKYDIISAEKNTETGKIAYLTFDDGVSSNTEKILDILKEYGIHATFFPNWKSGWDTTYKRIVDEGHTLGNHTYSHNYTLVYQSPDSFRSEVTKLNDKIYQITGVRPTVFRFPGGSNTTKYRRAIDAYDDTYPNERKIIHLEIAILYELNMEYFDWNVSSGDASANSPLPVRTLINNVLNGVGSKKKAIILMHDTGSKDTTVEALPAIIEGLIKKGYSFGILTNSTPAIHFIE